MLPFIVMLLSLPDLLDKSVKPAKNSIVLF